MAVADMKNDFVFRRIFAIHPDVLLLERKDDQTIEQIEYLPGEQLELAVRAVGEGERWGTKSRWGGGGQA
jgi:hypothetical protein